MITIKTPISIAYGDGIGPEIMEAGLRILEAAGAQISYEEIEIGEKVYLAGNSSGIKDDAWESLLRTKVFLKGPITTPFGGGYKSLNVTTRKTLGLFANVRPCIGYSPYIKTLHPTMDVVIIRENEEDLYAGIEHRQTNQVYQCLKIISRPGSEKIVRYAFEYARNNNRKKVSCFVKDNIMKLTDGVFHDVFKEVATEYPEIESNSFIIDIGTARLADTPEMFDVIVTLNLYGDIISDVAAQISGSIGIGPSANIGDKCAMFEAIHGSAPTIAGQNIANPSGLILSTVMMLVHINQPLIAAKINNAWLKTIEDGLHTADIFHPETSVAKLGTKEFASELINRLGEIPTNLPKAVFANNINPINPSKWKLKIDTSVKRLVGVDIFLDFDGIDIEEFGNKINALTCDGLNLEVISNRGVKIWPNGLPETFCTDHWRCRFEIPNKSDIMQYRLALNQIEALIGAGFDVIKTENLYYFDETRGYSLAQGQ